MLTLVEKPKRRGPLNAGDRIESLTIIEQGVSNARKERVYLCRCDCGQQKEISAGGASC